MISHDRSRWKYLCSKVFSHVHYVLHKVSTKQIACLELRPMPRITHFIYIYIYTLLSIIPNSPLKKYEWHWDFFYMHSTKMLFSLLNTGYTYFLFYMDGDSTVSNLIFSKFLMPFKYPLCVSNHLLIVDPWILCFSFSKICSLNTLFFYFKILLHLALFHLNVSKHFCKVYETLGSFQSLN